MDMSTRLYLCIHLTICNQSRNLFTHSKTNNSHDSCVKVLQHTSMEFNMFLRYVVKYTKQQKKKKKIILNAFSYILFQMPLKFK